MAKKPVLFVPHFFSVASWRFAEQPKTKAQGPQAVRQFWGKKSLKLLFEKSERHS
jgi:hypothetical protein